MAKKKGNSSTLNKITTRAKAIRKKSPNIKWTTAIKQASRELKQSGQIGAKTSRKKPGKRKTVPLKKKYRQTGTSNKKNDRERKAKAPGKRKTRHGTTYTERRKNRSDVPGSLSGMKQTVLGKLGAALLKYERATTIKATKLAAKEKTKWRKVLKAL